METQLELRMYFFVPYNLSPIQQGIQAGHAALEYASKYGKEEQFIQFVREYKTWIILNGGTTNEKRDFSGILFGTLDQIGELLLDNKIPFSYFKEPDLNDTLTAICFIADERVFDRETYPDFVDYLVSIYEGDSSPQTILTLKSMSYEELKSMYFQYHEKWVKLMGGEKNIFLRDLIRDKKLA